jgi:hypothetical protein
MKQSLLYIVGSCEKQIRVGIGELNIVILPVARNEHLDVRNKPTIFELIVPIQIYENASLQVASPPFLFRLNAVDFPFSSAALILPMASG